MLISCAKYYLELIKSKNRDYCRVLMFSHASNNTRWKNIIIYTVFFIGLHSTKYKTVLFKYWRWIIYSKSYNRICNERKRFCEKFILRSAVHFHAVNLSFSLYVKYMCVKSILGIPGADYGIRISLQVPSAFVLPVFWLHERHVFTYFTSQSEKLSNFF